MKLCSECGCVNGHHPNCPSYDEKDFLAERDIFEAYKEMIDNSVDLDRSNGSDARTTKER